MFSGWRLALAFIVLSPLTVIAFNITMRVCTIRHEFLLIQKIDDLSFYWKVVAKYTAQEIKAYSKASAVAQEVLGAIRTVTAFGGQKKEEKRFENER